MGHFSENLFVDTQNSSFFPLQRMFPFFEEAWTFFLTASTYSFPFTIMLVTKGMPLIMLVLKINLFRIFGNCVVGFTFKSVPLMVGLVWLTSGNSIQLLTSSSEFVADLGWRADQRSEVTVGDGELQVSRRSDQVLKLDGIFRSQVKVQDTSLNEISGMAASKYRADHVWVHNDSGGEPELYLLDADGKTALTLELLETKNRDWEDLASFRKGERNYLVVGDVGDNAERQASVRLWVVEERDWLGEGSQKVKVKPECEIEIIYPEGAQDCESIAVDGDSVYLVTKLTAKRMKQFPASAESGIYKVDFALRQAKQKVKAVRVGNCPLGIATAMAFSPDGRYLVVRDYLQVATYDRADSQSWSQRLSEKPSSRFPAPFQKQAEAICFSPDGMELWTISEGKKQPWWKAKLKKVDQ